MKAVASCLAAALLTVAVMVLAPTIATAATPPAATTGTATQITGSSTVLNATVNPNGAATTYVFEYGPTTSYASQTAITSAGSATSNIAVHATLTGLTASTSYHFRVVATSSAGTTNGLDGTFTTTKTPPIATTGSASMITSHSAIINATVNANGEATTYAFQYGLTTSYGSQTVTTTAASGTSNTAAHAVLNGLVSNTTYHFRIVATSADGTTIGSDAMLATSKVPPTATAGFPSVVMATSAVVTAIVNPNGKATTVVVQYGPTVKYALQATTMSAGSGTTDITVRTTLTHLAAGTTYHYRVIATSADGTGLSPDATLETTGTRATPNGPLPAVSEAASVAISAHGAQLNGAINPKGTSTTWYFEVGLTPNYGLQTPAQSISGLGARPVNMRLGGLQAGVTYHFRLVADSANGLYIGPDHTFNTKPPIRARAGGLLVSATGQRGYRILTITISGRLTVPNAIPARAACNGTVALVITQGNATIALRHASLRPDCSYRLNVHIAASRLHGNRAMGIVGYFWGNTLLLPTQTRGALRI